MDSKWFEKAKKLSLKEQWEALFKIKIGSLPIDFDYAWGKSSATGLKNAKEIIDKLPGILQKYKVRTFLDIGCGGYHWMSKIDFGATKYLGVDIVEDLIKHNQKKFKGVGFGVFDITNKIPGAFDMVFMRSVLIHLTIAQGLKAIDNIKKSKSRYLMVSTCPHLDINNDTNCLMLVNKNLQLKPFNFPKPLELIKQRPDVKGNDEYIGIWEIAKL